MATYTIQGQRIYAREEGPPQGQVALLLHGWSSSWFALSPLIEQVARRYRCLAVDLPGYGNSPPLSGRATIDAYADLVAELARTVTGGQVVLVGHSMGGMIAVTVALRHPQLVDRMVLICPTISGKLSGFINSAIAPITFLESSPLGAQISRAVESQFVSLTDMLMRPASFAERSGITEEDYRRLRADARRPGQGRTRAQCFRAMQQHDLRGELGRMEREVRTPTLALWGAEDNTVPLRDAGVVADEWPSADLRIIPKAGHWPQFEMPDTTRRYIASFLGLPIGDPRLDVTIGKAVDDVADVAQFLAASDIGGRLTDTQRARIAAHLNLRYYGPGKLIAMADEPAQHLFVVREGSVSVLRPGAPEDVPPDEPPIATLRAGQIAGELALLDGGPRSASLSAGPEGATLLSLRWERMVQLCRDDPDLGFRVLWNIAAALALRLRVTTRAAAERPAPLADAQREKDAHDNP